MKHPPAYRVILRGQDYLKFEEQLNMMADLGYRLDCTEGNQLVFALDAGLYQRHRDRAPAPVLP